MFLQIYREYTRRAVSWSPSERHNHDSVYSPGLRQQDCLSSLSGLAFHFIAYVPRNFPRFWAVQVAATPQQPRFLYCPRCRVSYQGHEFCVYAHFSQGVVTRCNTSHQCTSAESDAVMGDATNLIHLVSAAPPSHKQHPSSLETTFYTDVRGFWSEWITTYSRTTSGERESDTARAGAGIIAETKCKYIYRFLRPQG